MLTCIRSSAPIHLLIHVNVQTPASAPCYGPSACSKRHSELLCSYPSTHTCAFADPCYAPSARGHSLVLTCNCGACYRLCASSLNCTVRRLCARAVTHCCIQTLLSTVTSGPFSWCDVRVILTHCILAMAHLHVRHLIFLLVIYLECCLSDLLMSSSCWGSLYRGFPYLLECS